MPSTARAPSSPVRGSGAAGNSLPTRQRRPGYVALAVALIFVCAAVGAWLYAQAGEKTQVVVVARDVPAGQVIARVDLSTVAVAGGVRAVAGENLDGVVGQTAAVPMLQGMLVQRSMVSSAGPLTDGTAAVGVALKGGQLPADGVAPGDTVAVLQVPTAAGGGARSGGDGPQVLVEQARVFAAKQDPAQAGGTLLTVLVPTNAYLDVAAASAAGRVAVVEVAPQ